MPRVPPPPPRGRPAARPSFHALVERHGPGVLRFCVARLGPDAGEDAFQETLVSALRHYDDLRDPGAAPAWLFAIAQRRIVDAARARTAAPTPTPTDGLEAHAAVWHDPEPDGGVWALVAALPPKQREAVALRYAGDLAHEDVAAIAGTSVEAARRNVFEGLRRLRRALADEPGAP